MGNKNKKKNKNKKREEHENSQNAPESDPETLGEADKNLDEEEEVTKTQKRAHNQSDDSDNESEPKRKKKKKKPVNAEGTSDKNKKSIRQMKREKFAQRQADMQAAAKSQLKSQCLSYLSQWKHDKANWKFMKAKQVWLYKNKFSCNLVPNESWPLLMEYFESAKGNIRNMLLEDAHKVIKQMDDWTESQDKEVENNDEETEESEKSAESKKPDETVYKRARDLIQCLEE